mgnify:CR=1 FL=1
MKQPLVSIILPVYNAQSHLARCLSSICAQTYQNLEIIVLNDGSKDQSLPVCEEFRKKDSRIILVDKANSGVSDTRNLGLKLATGEYIQFVDSDDYIDPDYTGHLVAAAEEHHADLVIAPYKMVIPAGASKPEQVREKIVMGKMNKFYSENCLLQQEFVRGDVFTGTVEQYIADAAKKLGGKITFVDAIRFEKGEGIEKKQENFAEEIAKMVKG